MVQSLICIKSENDRNFEVIYLNRLKLSRRIQLDNLKPLFLHLMWNICITWPVIIVSLHKMKIENGVPRWHMMDIN